MKENQKLNKRWVLWLLVVFPILGVILLDGNSVLDRAVLRVEYYLWQIIQSVRNVPQSTFWAIFCGIYVLFILYSLISENKRNIRSKEEEVQDNRGRRVAFWANQIHMMHKGDFSQAQFAKIFSQLILSILTYNGDVDLTTYEGELRTGKLDVPNELLSYLKLRSRQLDELQSPVLISRNKALFSSKKPNLPRENNILQNSVVEQGLLVSVNYLENELKVDHNRNEK